MLFCRRFNFEIISRFFMLHLILFQQENSVMGNQQHGIKINLIRLKRMIEHL